MLEKGTLDEATAARALRSIQDNATRQVRLVDELLDLSRLTSGRLTLTTEDVDLRSLLHGVVDSIIPAAAAAGLDSRSARSRRSRCCAATPAASNRCSSIFWATR